MLQRQGDGAASWKSLTTRIYHSTSEQAFGGGVKAFVSCSTISGDKASKREGASSWPGSTEGTTVFIEEPEHTLAQIMPTILQCGFLTKRGNSVKVREIYLACTGIECPATRASHSQSPSRHLGPELACSVDGPHRRWYAQILQGRAREKTVFVGRCHIVSFDTKFFPCDS